MKRLLVSCSLMFAFLVCSGCSNKMPMGGVVTFADDGSPLTTGIVCFETDGYFSRGPLDKDGKYQISSTGQNDGLPKGKYKVYLTGAELSSGGENPIYTPLVDERHISSATSGLEFEVTGAERRFDFKVDRPKVASGKKR